MFLPANQIAHHVFYALVYSIVSWNNWLHSPGILLAFPYYFNRVVPHYGFSSRPRNGDLQRRGMIQHCQSDWCYFLGVLLDIPWINEAVGRFFLIVNILPGALYKSSWNFHYNLVSSLLLPQFICSDFFISTSEAVCIDIK